MGSVFCSDCFVLHSAPTDSEGEYNESLSYYRDIPLSVVYILLQLDFEFPASIIVSLSCLQTLPYVIATSRAAN
jgi:hypothetical protein